jgi:hypothetical protein
MAPIGHTYSGQSPFSRVRAAVRIFVVVYNPFCKGNVSEDGSVGVMLDTADTADY